MGLSSSDELAILKLLATYSAVVSSRDIQGWVDLYTPDSVWERKQPSKGSKYNEKVRIEGIEALREFAVENFATQGNVQYVTANAIVEGDEFNASGRATVFIISLEGGKAALGVVGNFEDEYVKTGNGWRFKYRGITLSV
jgi:ketosteroid isomerase-like protein